MRFLGWSVDRVDGSSSLGTFDRQETAEEWAAKLRGYGNDVHVVRAEVPDEDEIDRRELARLRVQRDAVLAFHRIHENGPEMLADTCVHCAFSWPCPTAEALGVPS